MTAGQYQALAKALAYIIKALPVPKTDKGKAEKQTILQGLINASRSRAAAPDDEMPAAPRGGAAQRSAEPPPDVPPAPTMTMKVEYGAPPPGIAMPDVREGTVGGVPSGLADEFTESE